MHFLCLHGQNTNSKIFEMETLPIRHALSTITTNPNQNHTYHFLQGTHPAAPELHDLYKRLDPATVSSLQEFASDPTVIVGPCFNYAKEDNLQSWCEALEEMVAYIDEQGPFDAVMGTCSGAGYAAALVAYDVVVKKRRPAIRCGVFFLAPGPGNVVEAVTSLAEAAEKGASASAEEGDDGSEARILLPIPTAHIVGGNDTMWEDGRELPRICREDVCEEYVHRQGHTIPGVRNPEDVAKIAKIVKRTIERASDF